MSIRPILAGAVAASLVMLCVQAREGDGGDPIRLSGPRVLKLDWGTRAMTAADLDGDKRTDLALLNNDRARIELLYQKNEKRKEVQEKRRVSRDRWEPVLDDAPFQKVSVPTGIQMFDLAVGDFNGDGRADLAYSGNPDALTVRFQSEDERFEESRVFDLEGPTQWTGTIRSADLNRDGRDDLLVLTEKSLAVFVQNNKGTLTGPRLYALSDVRCAGLKVVDANGDGEPDALYLAPQESNPLRVRLGTGEGNLGPEQSFHIPPPRTDMNPIRLSDPKGIAFAYVQRQSGMIELLRPREGDGKSKSVSVKDLRPGVFSTRSEAKTPASYATGDFDGDGNLDVAAGDAEGAEVLLYFQKEKGRLSEAEKFPSYSDVRSVAAADLDGDKKSELIVVSPREQQLGLSRFDNGRMSYPEAIAVEGKPLAVAATDLGQDGSVEILVVTENEKKRNLRVLRRGEGVAWNATTVEFKELRQDPSDLRLVDFNADGRLDVAVFAPGQPMRVLVQDGQGGFTQPGASEASKAKDSFIDKLTASGLTVGDLDGDGEEEVFVAGEGFARSVRLNESGGVDVRDQFNARRADSPVAAAVPVDLDGDGKGELLLIDTKAGVIQLLKSDETGVYRFAEEQRIGKIDLVEARVLDIDGDKSDDLMLFGKDRFWWVPVRPGGFGFDTLNTYETDLRDVRYTDLAVGDLNGDGAEDLLAADTAATHVVELLRVGKDAQLTSATHFTAYEVDPFYSGRGTQDAEPRQILIEDVTGDGKQDLVFLIHDRVLVYPQK